MRSIHPAAWAGIFLQLAFALVTFSALANADLSMFEPQDRQSMEEYIRVLLEVGRPLFLGFLAAQAGALLLMAYRVPFGLGIAMITGFLSLPISLIYLVGCLLTHYRIRYSDYPIAPKDYSGARFIFRSLARKRMMVFMGAGFAFCMAFMVMGIVNMAATFLAVGLAGAYCAHRAASHHALSIHKDYITVSPGLFADRLLLPYAIIRMATLNENNTITFEVDTLQGSKSLVWSLLIVEPAQRRQAIEELGAALDAHGVPLQ